MIEHRPRLALQWGHVDEDVEEAGRHSIPAAVTSLQWGHVDEDVEESKLKPDMSGWVLLQWGHVDEDVEEIDLEAVARAMQVASMGPRR